MITKNKSKIFLTLALTAALSSSCVSDAWNEHFENANSDVTSATLNTSIKSDPELTTFYTLLEKCGYDQILNSPESYTVWAPDNDALNAVNINSSDTSMVGNLVRNHIARFNYPISGFNQVNNKRVLMLSGKIINYSKPADSALTFGNYKLLSGSKLTSNGTLHKINGYVKYESNIWEYLATDTRLSSLWDYWRPLGNTPYGEINNEDSVYTALLPSNNAWNKAYDAIKGYFRCLPNTGIDSSAAKQERLTKNAIVSDLIFSGAIVSPGLVDTLVSTNKKTLSNASDLFTDAQKISCSNGLIYLTDSIRTNKFETWNKPIVVEAEETLWGRSSLNSSINPLNATNSAFEDSISESYYVEVVPLTTSNISQVSVTFPIPNTLSTKYSILCRFVPASIKETKPADQLPCLVNFYLDYINSNGLVVASQLVSQNVETKGTEVCTIKAGEITLNYCNILSSLTGDITVKLKVANAAKLNQTTKYTRTMRIDCVTLVPVN